MSIDERISDALFDYCIAWRDRASAVQDKIEIELRAAIKQHVAEAVAEEREACAQTCEDAELLDRQSREDMAYCEAVSHCADLIRARGTP